jgi:hypothetical protein
LDLVLDVATTDDADDDHGDAEHDQDGRGEIATDGETLATDTSWRTGNDHWRSVSPVRVDSTA